MVDDGDGVALGGADGPTPAEEVDLMIGVETAGEVEGEVKVEEAGIWTGTHGVASVGDGLGPSVVGAKTRGSANGPVLLLQFVVEEVLGPAVIVDALESEQGQKAFLEGAETALDLAFGLGTRSDKMRDPQRGERPLEFRAGIPAIGRGLVAEEGQSVGVEGHGTAVPEEGAAEVFEMMPGGVGRDKSGPEVFAGMVVDGEEEGLLVLGRPPGVDGGVVLPEFADA